MVMGVKNGTMSEQEYIDLYYPSLNSRSIIGNVSCNTWDKLLMMETATFVCFCPQEAFCHRNILVHYIMHVMNGRVRWGGWRDAA